MIYNRLLVAKRKAERIFRIYHPEWGNERFPVLYRDGSTPESVRQSLLGKYRKTKIFGCHCACCTLARIEDHRGDVAWKRAEERAQEMLREAGV